MVNTAMKQCTLEQSLHGAKWGVKRMERGSLERRAGIKPYGAFFVLFREGKGGDSMKLCA